MIAWFTKNHVAANLLMATILSLGLGSLSLNIPLEVFPSIEPRAITVNVAAPGMTPEEAEEGISVKVEEAVQDLEGISKLSSRSSEGSASITIEVDEDYNPRQLLSDVKNRVDAINSFPSDAEKPIISLAKRSIEVITVAVSGPYGELEIRRLAEQVRDDLLRIEGVTQVELDGVREYEIAIELDEQTLQRYNISLSDVANAISLDSRNVSAGNINASGGDILIRSTGQAYRQDDFASIIILTQADGSVVRLGDIARISDGFTEAEISSRFNGQQAAFVEVYRVGSQSAIDVADKVKDYIDSAQASLPEGVSLGYWRDRSKIVKNRLQTLSNSAMQGGFLVLALLTLFLRPDIAFWVCIGIPVAFMGAFFAMPIFGVSLNIISLFGFIVVLGIVVDDAIVTGENIYSHLRHSEDGLQAAVNGTKEVAVPVTFGILTTVAAFLPIAFIEGVRGQLFAAIPVVVIPILLFSLIESKLILPAHLKNINLRGYEDSKLSRWQKAFADGFENAILRYYHPALKVCLAHRYLVLSIGVGMLILLYALMTSGWMKFIFFPRVQSEVARAYLALPQGTPFEVTDRYVAKMTDAAFELKQKYYDAENDEEVILNILSVTGSANSNSAAGHFGRVQFEITAPEHRLSSVTSRELVQEWRKMIGQVPGAESLNFRAEIGRVNSPLDIELRGQDFDALSEVSDKIKAKLSQYETLFDIEDSFSDGKETVEIKLRDEAYILGLTRQDVISQVREAFYGFQVQRVQRGREDIKVVVRYTPEDRASIQSLNDFIVTSRDGSRIPLVQVADLVPDKSPATIYRIDRDRTVNVRADVDKQATNMLVLQEELSVFIDEIIQQYPGVTVNYEGEAKEQRQSFGSLKWGLLFVLFVIYCLLAIPFKSYAQPFIVMTVIPFGAIGAIGGHALMGMDLTLISLLGMLALIGVMVNDSLVLVDYINKHRDRYASIVESVSHAGVARFRPVILTSLTTFLGLTPLLFEKSTQAQFLIPMAVSLGFGIMFATVITLIIVPINYLVIEDMRGLFSKEVKQTL